MLIPAKNEIIIKTGSKNQPIKIIAPAIKITISKISPAKIRQILKKAPIILDIRLKKKVPA